MILSSKRRSPGARAARLAAAAAVALLGLISVDPATSAPRGVEMHSVQTHRAITPSQELVGLLAGQEAMSRPSEHSAVLTLLRARRPITGEETVLPVIAHEIVDGRQWLDVMLPGRPNGRTGWIRERSTRLSTTWWHILVDISTRRVTVDYAAHPVRVFTAIVGKPSTPTPQGNYFVEESVQLRSTDVGAPFALALSARSNALQEFDGGPGQIALHGVANVGGVLGTAVSHGCVRLDSAAMRWLVARIGPGVPVTID
jgi:lipoprotein-anchoring transpeptidase ErfK/SrfK